MNQQDVTDPIEFERDAAGIISLMNTGKANFKVQLSDMSGHNDQKLINTIGDYNGEVIAPITPGKYVFEITYGEKYSLDMIDPGEPQTAPVSLSETDGKVIPMDITDPLRINLEARKKDNVKVSLHNGLGQKVENLVNEIGPSETTFMIRQTGEGYLFFDLKGDWEAEIKEI